MLIDDSEIKVLIAVHIWNLLPDKEAFKQRLLAYLKTGFSDYKVIRIERPYVICVKK